MNFIADALKEGFIVSLCFSNTNGLNILTYIVTAHNGEEFKRGHNLGSLDVFDLNPALETISISARKTILYIKEKRPDALKPKNKHEDVA